MLLFGRETLTDEEFTFQTARLLALAADMERVRRGVPPEAMADDEAPILDRWVLAQRWFLALPGCRPAIRRLVGQGRLIGTSDLWLLSEDRAWARTLRGGIDSDVLPSTPASMREVEKTAKDSPLDRHFDRRRKAAIAGLHLPSEEELLRGMPFLGGRYSKTTSANMPNACHAG